MAIAAFTIELLIHAPSPSPFGSCAHRPDHGWGASRVVRQSCVAFRLRYELDCLAGWLETTYDVNSSLAIWPCLAVVMFLTWMYQSLIEPFCAGSHEVSSWLGRTIYGTTVQPAKSTALARTPDGRTFTAASTAACLIRLGANHPSPMASMSILKPLVF
jgi:hypothetical protein